MEPGHLLWMLEKMSLAYYPEGEVILSPERGVAGRLLVIKQGKVDGVILQGIDLDSWFEIAKVIPALIISTASGIIVTRTAADSDMGRTGARR